MTMANPRTSLPNPPDTVAAEARSKKSSALFILACVFLATGALRANDLRHDVVTLLSSTAHAATDPGAGPHDTTQGIDDPHPKPAAMATDGAHEPTMPAMDHKALDHKTMPPATEPGHKPMASSGAGDMAKKAEDRCLTGAFLAAALEREQELNAMALQIDSRKRELQVAEKRVADQIAELTTQQKALAAAFGQADATAEEEAMQLVAIYKKNEAQASLSDLRPDAARNRRRLCPAHAADQFRPDHGEYGSAESLCDQPVTGRPVQRGAETMRRLRRLLRVLPDDGQDLKTWSRIGGVFFTD